MKRWLKRITLGLLALVVGAVITALIILHTDFGRERVRRQVESALVGMFTGGARIGRIDGSAFGELVIRDLVINGPDQKPAITVHTLRLHLHLFDLVRHRLHVSSLVAEDVDVLVKRARDGHFELAQLLKPNPNPSTWHVILDDVHVRRAHAMIDTGTQQAGVVDLDDVTVDANADLPNKGDREASLRLTGAWRERASPVAIDVHLRTGQFHTTVPVLDVSVGDVKVMGRGLDIDSRDGNGAMLGGVVAVYAPRVGVRHLVEQIDLRQDLSLVAVVSRAALRTTDFVVAASYGPAFVNARGNADLKARHVVGTLVTNDVELAKLTDGRIHALVGISADFDVLPGAEFPIARANVRAHASGGVDAQVTADVVSTAHAIELRSAHVVASTRDPRRVAGPKEPVRGTFALDLTGHGALLPHADLALAGTITGDHIAAANATIGTARVEIAATHLPDQPHGSAHVKLTDITRENVAIRLFTLDAHDRADGKIAVALATYPKQDPWLVELAALVTPPGRGSTVTIDLEHHRVHTAKGTEWSGDGGRIVIDPEHVAATGINSHARAGSLTLAATYMRVTGDLATKLDVTGMQLAGLVRGYTGDAGAHLDVARRGGLWSGTAKIDAAGLTFKRTSPLADMLPPALLRIQPEQNDIAKRLAAETPTIGPFDIHLDAKAQPGSLVANAKVSSAKVGSAEVQVDLAAPQNIADAAAWRLRGRSAIRNAVIAVHAIDLGKLAASAAPNTRLTGFVDGELRLTATTATGTIRARKLWAPALAKLGPIDADLALTQPSLDELEPTLSVKIQDLGTITADAKLRVPARMFDPHAWRVLGLATIRSGSLRAKNITVDPGVFAKFDLVSKLRGRVSFDVELAEGGRSVTATVDANEVRGSPIAKPVDVHLQATVDEHTANASLAIREKQTPVALLELHGSIPISLERLRADPAAARTIPVTAKVDIHTASAPLLLDVFGRTEIRDGTLSGTITLAGTIGQPKLVAHLVGDNLGVPPGPRGKPIKSIQHIVLDADMTKAGGKLTIDATELKGGKLSVVANINPRSLASGTAKLVATHFDMSPLMAFAPGPAGAAAGTLDANLAIKGFDPRTALVSGELHLHDARVPVAPMLGTLRDATLDVVIRQHDIAINANGKMGAGTAVLVGAIDLDGASLSGGHAKLTLRKMSPIGEIEPLIDADVDAKLARRGTQWTADIVVNNGKIKVEKTKGEKLKPVGPPRDLRLGATPNADAHRGGAQTPPPKQAVIVMNVTINPVFVESEEFRTLIHGKLTITADANGVGIVGTITADRGDLDLFDRRYQVEEAIVSFDGTVDPLLDIRFTHDYPAVTTITMVRGRLSKPRLIMQSDPSIYTQGQLLGFLLGGEPNGDPTSGSARDKATSAGASLIANQLGGYIKKALPIDIDVIRYEAADSSSSAAVTVGTWITHTVFFAFRTHLSARPDENSGEGTLEYWFTRRTMIEATAGDRNVDGVDILWRKRY